jgi:hypothetical protein
MSDAMPRPALHHYYGLVRLPAPVHRRLRLLAFPTRTLGASCHRPDAGPPSFRPDPSARDVLFDPGRVSRASRWRVRSCCVRTLRKSPPPAIRIFRGSITHPTQQLCMLRGRRCLRLTQHSPPGGSLSLTWAGLSPADRASLLAPSSTHPTVRRCSARLRLLLHAPALCAARDASVGRSPITNVYRIQSQSALELGAFVTDN